MGQRKRLQECDGAVGSAEEQSEGFREEEEPPGGENSRGWKWWKNKEGPCSEGERGEPC